MHKSVYESVKDFKRKFPGTVAWRIKKHAKIIEKHLSDEERVLFSFAGQKNNNSFDIITSCVVTLTSKRILIGQKRVLFGYFFSVITPDMFNDLTIKTNILWGTICIDTVKEVVYLSNISKKSLPIIESEITSYIMKEKMKYKTDYNEVKKNAQC